MHFGGFSDVGDVASMREESSIHPWFVFQFDHGTKFVMFQSPRSKNPSFHETEVLFGLLMLT